MKHNTTRHTSALCCVSSDLVAQGSSLLLRQAGEAGEEAARLLCWLASFPAAPAAEAAPPAPAMAILRPAPGQAVGEEERHTQKHTHTHTCCTRTEQRKSEGREPLDQYTRQ